MKKAVGYIRISTTDQSNFSLDGQEEYIRTHCDRNGIELLDIFRDDGQSAKSFDRAERSESFTAGNTSGVEPLASSSSYRTVTASYGTSPENAAGVESCLSADISFYEFWIVRDGDALNLYQAKAVDRITVDGVNARSLGEDAHASFHQAFDNTPVTLLMDLELYLSSTQGARA